MQVNKAVKKEFIKNASTVGRNQDAKNVAVLDFATTGEGKNDAKIVVDRLFATTDG
jgi:hypothetical protein